MALYDRIRRLSREKKYSINRLEKDIGVARGSICKWDTIKPSYDKVLMVADCFNMTMDELLRG